MQSADPRNKTLHGARNRDVLYPTVTAIVPTYNRAGYVSRSLDSVLNQTLPPTEVIVVNDGSTDGTREVLRAFGSRITVIEKANGGKASALNLALSVSSGELIWIFDDDDVALPDALEKMVTALVENPECGFAYGGYAHLQESEDGEPSAARVRLCIDHSLDLRLSILERCYIFQPGMLVRRVCYDSVGLFDESLVRSQDYDMLIRISRNYKGVDVNGILFYQRQHSGLRGSAKAPVEGRSRARDAAWLAYDRLIFSRIRRDYSLSEYLSRPRSGEGELTASDRRLAILERCCIMVRKGMWQLAADDLQSFAALVKADSSKSLSREEAAIARRFFGPYSYADHAIAESGVFFATLNEFVPGKLRWKLARLLVSPWVSELVFSIRHAHPRHFVRSLRRCLQICRMMAQSRGAVPLVRSVTGIEH